MNTNDPVEDLDGLPSTAFAATSFPGARFVKGFNHLLARTLATDPNVEGGHRVVFLSSDDEAATAQVADLAKRLGFATVYLGKLDEEIGRASCRERVCQYVSISVVAVSLQNNNRLIE